MPATALLFGQCTPKAGCHDVCHSFSNRDWVHRHQLSKSWHPSPLHRASECRRASHNRDIQLAACPPGQGEIREKQWQNKCYGWQQVPRFCAPSSSLFYVSSCLDKNIIESGNDRSWRRGRDWNLRERAMVVILLQEIMAKRHKLTNLHRSLRGPLSTLICFKAAVTLQWTWQPH